MKKYIDSLMAVKGPQIIVGLFFAAYLCVGLGVFGGYGLCTDEGPQRKLGLLTLRYIVEGDRELLEYRSRYHGPAFQVLLVTLEKSLRLRDSRSIYMMRHLVTFLLFYLGVIFFYKLCVRRFGSWKVGLLGGLFLILSPRIFAHSFYNPKDIPFLSLFVISVYTLVLYLENKTPRRAAAHALTSALLIDVRVVGVIVPLLTAILVGADLALDKGTRKQRREVLKTFSLYAALSALFTVLFWPVLWTDPLRQFIRSFEHMSRYPWPGTVLYLGDYLKGGDVPWHYIPVWMGITTPLLYTFGFFAGLFVSARLLLRNPRGLFLERRDDLLYLLWFFMPLVAIVVLRSVVYGGWRHLFYIYPAFLLISLNGFVSLYGYIKGKCRGLSCKVINSVYILMVAFGLANVAFSMIRNHPYQNVYFNILAGRNAEEVSSRFKLDYWGLSYRQGLEYILENDKREIIKVCVDKSLWRGRRYSRLLTPHDQKRLVYVEDPDKAEYFLGVLGKQGYPYGNECYSIRVNGMKIMAVYELFGWEIMERRSDIRRTREATFSLF